MMDIDDMIREVDQSIEWFCDKVIEPVPLDRESKDKVMLRMVNLGWLRKSEYETYKELTKEE